MRIAADTRYVHPVMAETNGDYQAFEAHTTFEPPRRTADGIEIEAYFEVSNGFLASCIDSGTMGVGYYLVCEDTMFNRLVRVAVGSHKETIGHGLLFGTCILQPVAFSFDGLTGSRTQEINPEFGDKFDIDAASLTMIGNKFRFRVEPEKLQPFGSLYALAVSDKLEPDLISVDVESDKIQILAEKDTHQRLLEMRNVPGTRDLLMNSVYLPAVMETLDTIGKDDQNLGQYAWYEVVLERCNTLGLDPTSGNDSLYIMAQKLMSLPLGRMFAFNREDA